jgi:tetratricopeptide (TPR) repeat protein
MPGAMPADQDHGGASLDVRASAPADGDADALLRLGQRAEQRGELAAAASHYAAAAAAAPDAPWPRLALGSALRRLARLDDAESELRRAAAHAPTGFQALLELGHCAHARGDPAAALGQFEAAGARDPANPWPPVYAGDMLRRLGRRDAATAAYRRAADGPARFAAELGLGHAAREAGEPAAALAHYLAAAEADPANPWPHVYAGDELRRLRRMAEAEAAYRRAGEHGPARVPVLLGLGHCARALGDATAALALFTAASESDPGDPWPKLYVGETLQAQDCLPEAEAAYRRALAADPRHAPSALALGLLARQRGDRATAADCFERASRFDPALTPAWLELATELRDQGEGGKALALLGALFAREPGNVAAGIALARAQRQADAAAAAHATLSAVVAAAPADVDARIELASLELRLSRPGRATALLEQVVADAPESCRALEQLAELSRLGRDFSRARALLLRAIDAEPANPWPRIGLSQVLADLGRLAEALAALDEAETRLAAAAPGRAAVAARRVELLRRAGHWEAALRVARRSRAAWPLSFPLWVQSFLIELPVGGADAVAACLDAAPAGGAEEQARLHHLRGQAAEAAWNLDAAAEHYGAALALAPDDAWVHMDLARAHMLRLDAVAARAHLLASARLQAGTARLEGRSPNVSQTHYGQILDEYDLEPEGLAALAALRALPPAERIAPTLALARRLPGFTPAAVALLVSLRQAGLLAPAASLAGAVPPIPPRIAMFWNDPAPPDDVLALMRTWAEQHPGHVLHRFDDAAAAAFLADAFAPDVLAAYRRAREPAMKADLFRLAWLYASGGWYVDADDRCHAPLPGLAPAGAGLVAYQEDLGTLANDVLGAVPQHPVLGRALDLAVGAVLRGDQDVLWLATGPGLLTRAFAATLAESRLGVRGWLAHVAVLDRSALFRAVAVHCFVGYKASARHWSRAALRRRTDAG